MSTRHSCSSLIALIAYFVAYRYYGKWYDRVVWRTDAGRTTPAHMYLDGVEYFPGHGGVHACERW